MQTASVMQRGRGVYLARVYETTYTTEDCDAFSTVAAAKRWCAQWHGRQRLLWKELRVDGHWARWEWTSDAS